MLRSVSRSEERHFEKGDTSLRWFQAFIVVFEGVEAFLGASTVVSAGVYNIAG